jgi:hypothetical protein
MSFATGPDDVDREPYLGYLNALAFQFHLLFTAMAHGQVTILPSSCLREKRIVCGGPCKESHPGTSLVSAKSLSPYTSGP